MTASATHIPFACTLTSLHASAALLDATQDGLDDLDEQELRFKMSYTCFTEIHEIIVAAENMHSSHTDQMA